MKKIYTIHSLDDLAHQFWRRAEEINDQLHAASKKGSGPRISLSEQRALAWSRETWREASLIVAQTALVVRAPNQTENDNANQG